MKLLETGGGQFVEGHEMNYRAVISVVLGILLTGSYVGSSEGAGGGHEYKIAQPGETVVLSSAAISPPSAIGYRCMDFGITLNKWQQKGKNVIGFCGGDKDKAVFF